MKVYVTRRYVFPASHRLHSPSLTAAENSTLYGKCNNPYGHGHNYELFVTVSGPVNPKTGMVCNLLDIDGLVQREVLNLVDHANLNKLDIFQELVPTTENLTLAIQRILDRGFKAARVERVKIQETRKNSFVVLAPSTSADANRKEMS